MSNLAILNTDVRSYENLFNLKDLHIASGNEKKHEPNRFIRLDQTKELIAEIESEAPNTKAVKTLRGTHGGTYACEELVLSYAMWISPKFHLVVLRAFLAMHKGEVKQQQLALPEPEKKYPFELSESDLQNLAWDWFALFKCVEFTRNIVPALDAIQSKFAPQARSIVSEYGSMLRHHQSLIQKLTAQFEIETWGDENWNRVLPTIRDNTILTPRKRLPHHNF
ncbi:P22AR C-terminal domain-containing protein [Avibacterium paragallinarum]|uniref:P22AR C-terminal domain-containing protein n=1 Tax=Avibacterium paragallinarum TaxID=728 RepID=UPI0010295120|nr:P22AR C-terminal domain-containing protein [Avibacterium paragallinarum]RZN51771.1 bacteriocin [Avibacterium paragallinarum]